MFKLDPGAWKLGNVEGDCLFLYSDSRTSPQDVFSYLRRLYEKFWGVDRRDRLALDVPLQGL